MKRQILQYSLALLTFFLLAACSTENGIDPTVVQVTRLVPVVETSEPIEVTRVIMITPSVPVSSATTDNGSISFQSEDPDTLRHVVSTPPLTLDPVLANDPASIALLTNVIEPLLYPDPFEPGNYLPLLATRWEISEDGLTAIFNIRSDVTFSDGSDLTASDLAYSIQRALLLSPPGGSQGQLLEPLLGYSSGDITEELGSGASAGDRDALITNVPAQELAAVCERVKNAVVADDSAGTLTFNLSTSWGALPATLSQPWTGAVDRNWAIDQGGWDDSCETWQNWYAPAVGESALDRSLMGTGPYSLDHWTPNLEYLLIARSDYWRGEDEPFWDAEGAPAGSPAIDNVLVQFEPEAAIRLATLQHGAVDIAEIAPSLRLLADVGVGELCTHKPGSCTPGEDEQAPLRKISPLPSGSRTDLLFNFAITGDDNLFLGSRQLDGNGIPADFFSDFNVRRGFSHCVDPSRLEEMVYFGSGIPNNSVIPPFMLGHNPRQETRELDLGKCREQLLLAWNGQVASNGFRLQAPFITGNRTQEVILASLQENLQAVDERYRLEMLGLPEPQYVGALRSGQLPLLFLTWTETLHDPHNWAVPYFSGSYAEYQALPVNLQDQFALLVSAGAAATNPTGRDRIYSDLGRIRFSVAPNIIFPQAGQAMYQQRWISQWLINPANPFPYYYAYAKQ